jgi:hypothetical protein
VAIAVQNYCRASAPTDGILSAAERQPKGKVPSPTVRYAVIDGASPDSKYPMTDESKSQTDVPGATVDSPEIERRRELRAFLTTKRSELAPETVGFPRGARRRVAGLRRAEVAELIGVSTEWYRWFETGRTVRVSQHFLARLAEVLRLMPTDQVALYRLALPELYEAARAAHGAHGALSAL